MGHLRRRRPAGFVDGRNEFGWLILAGQGVEDEQWYLGPWIEVGVHGKSQPYRNLKLSPSRSGFHGSNRLLIRGGQWEVGDTDRGHFDGCVGVQCFRWNQKRRRTVAGNDVRSLRGVDHASARLRFQTLALSGHAGQKRERVPRPEKLEGKDGTCRREANITAQLIDLALQEFAEQAGFSFPGVQIHNRRTRANATSIEGIQRDDRGFTVRIQKGQAGVIAGSFGHLREKQIRITFALSFDGG